MRRELPPDFDPSSVPIKRASTVVITRDAPHLEVLLLRRNARSIFVPNMWLYPGGAVDDDDAHPSVLQAFDGLDRVVGQMDLPPNEAAAHWVAAVRETVEEAGIVLGADAHRSWFDSHRVPSWREQLNSGRADFATATSSTATRFNAATIAYIGRFITPFGAPRRYDTRFFVTPMPSGQTPSPDDSEAIDLDWMSPLQALDRLRSGAMEMVTPTIAILMRLARYGSVDELMHAAMASSTDQRVRMRTSLYGADAIAFAEDHDYEHADERAEHGSVMI